MRNKFKSQIGKVSDSTSPVVPFGLASAVTLGFAAMINAKVKSINGLTLRNGGSGLVRTFLMFLDLVWPRRKCSVVAATVTFSRLVNLLVRTQGMKGAVLYLKAAHVLLMQSVAGNRVKDISDLKVRVKRTRGCGIPRFIPRQMRARLRLGDVGMFRT
jgi:hypothetical protein